MAKEIYHAGDVEGYDLGFPTVGKHIDWTPVIEAAEAGNIRLTLETATLFAKEQQIRQKARLAVRIPRGADEKTIKGNVYASMRAYVREVARREFRARLAEEEYSEDEIDDMEADAGDDISEESAVALLSAVTML